MKNTFILLFALIANFLMAQTGTKEQIISDLPEIEITKDINLHIISPEPIQYVDLSTQTLTGDLPTTNIARIKITDNMPVDTKEKTKTANSFSQPTLEFVANAVADTNAVRLKF